MDIGRKLADLERRLAAMENSPRLSHASIDNTSVEVRDSTGSLRGLLGVQSDGTTAVNMVNGPPPPQPSVPILTSVLGGITASWDGTFDGGATLPLDWQRIEVHASPSDGVTPSPATLQGTIETPQGSTVVVITDTPVYVRLLARTTSGTASTPSGQAGPLGPTQVVADDILDGIVTTVKLADEAVTAAKVRVGAIGADQLALGIGNLAPDPSFEGAHTEQLVDGQPAWTIVTPGNNSPKALHVDCTSGAVTWKNLILARIPVLSGERHFLAVDYQLSAAFDGTGAKLMFRYEDATGAVTGWGVADNPPAPGAGWERATAQVQAPAGTVTAVLMVEVSEVTAGEAWFDNAEVHTLIVGGMIAAGAVTATEIAAGSIETGHLVAEAVQAGNIAAGAVTTAKLDALAVTADKIDTNAITAEKIDAGAVDATALAADAVTGKTITGGTITGSVIQTEASGERITLNEAGANMILVYDASGEPIGELSAAGLLVKGTGGAVLHLDPNNTYPNLKMTNAALTNAAIINVVETTPGAADLGLNTGTFTANGFTDMTWRTFMGNDFAVIERYSKGNPTTNIGGRLDMRNNYALIGYQDDTGATQPATMLLSQGLSTLGARCNIQPNAGDASTLLFLQPGPSHTGPILRYYDPDASTYRFTLDKAGNVNINGSLTAGNIAAGRLTITPVANTPTSQNVTGLSLKGTNIRVVATAATSVPGTQVTGVGVTNQSATGFTVWVTRTNTTGTVIDWHAYGV